MKNLWLLNPDAELELAHFARGLGGSYTTPARTRQAMETRRHSFSDLTRGEPQVFPSDLGGRVFETSRWIPWCPTPSLLKACQSARISLPTTPTLQTLIECNDKTNLDRWGLPTVAGRIVATTESEIRTQMSSHAVFRLKRPFGFAGRGQRRVTSSWSRDDFRWVQDSLSMGPLVVEPELDRHRLYSLHLLINARETIVGTPIEFSCDEFGSFRSWGTAQVPQTVCDQIVDSANSMSARLLEANYAGPVSVDFAKGSKGELFAIDLNARFSLGWSQGMQSKRARALALYAGQSSN